jgi:hypothetical protein
MKNFTPISLLTTSSKLLVKVMCNRLSKNTMVPEHFGLREDTSTGYVAHKLAVTALKYIEQTMHVG